MKKFIFCLMLVAVLSMTVQAVNYSKPGLTDRWETLAEAAATVQIATVPSTFLPFLPPPSGTQEGLPLTKPVIAQAFLVPDGTTDLRLKKIAIFGDGGNATTRYRRSIRLVDLGDCDSTEGTLAGGGPKAYNSGLVWGGSSYTDNNNLLLKGDGSQERWRYFGFGTKQVVSLDFLSDNDITLIAGHSYSFEMDLLGGQADGTPDVADGFYWSRDGNYYQGGAGFKADLPDGNRTYLHGSNTNRTMLMSVYLVPEPTTIALLCIGGLSLLRKKR